MIVTYKPAGGDERTWTYRAAEMSSGDAEDIEDAVGKTFDEWQMALQTGGAKARRALLWIMLRRDTPGLRFRDVQFKMGELEVEFEREEKARLRAEVEKLKDIADADREQLLSLLADDEGDQAPAEQPAPKDDGQASASSD